MIEQVVTGPLLIPREGGRLDFFAEGALACDRAGVLEFAGDARELKCDVPARRSAGIMLPPFVDIHTHIPQHPIRGDFLKGVAPDAVGGLLLNGLRKNVFPAEAKCNDRAHAESVVKQFLADTLAHGVVGGAAYMTVSAAATEAALEILPESWSVGMVLMNQNSPLDLTTHEASLESDLERLFKRFGNRLIITDRFAIAVSTPLRQKAAELARKFNLRTQTHLNEQTSEKSQVEKVLYPTAKSYTDVYLRDGLLDRPCIVAHCIHMRSSEWTILQDKQSIVAHCPTSNLLLGSGRMDLDELVRRQIPYAIATDVGASPTVSMLAEMGRFVKVHAGQSNRATPEEALHRATRAPGEILGLPFGKLEVGKPMSFVEVDGGDVTTKARSHEVIQKIIPKELDHPKFSVARVTIKGKVVFERGSGHA